MRVAVEVELILPELRVQVVQAVELLVVHLEIQEILQQMEQLTLAVAVVVREDKLEFLLHQEVPEVLVLPSFEPINLSVFHQQAAVAVT
jgi:hypothetical protein